MDRRARVELFAEIRREYQFGVGTIKGVARKLGVHRRVVRQALADAVPPVRTYRRAREADVGPGARPSSIGSLEADRTAPRKQRHTARRIHDRLQARAAGGADRGVDGARVRAGVEARPGPARPDGVRAADVRLGAGGAKSIGTKRSRSWVTRTVTLQVFCLRSMASGAAFHRAYPRATQQAFLEAHEGAFRVLRGRVRDPAVRQSDQRGPQDPAGIPARGDDAVPGVSIALAVRRGVLHAGRRAREGRRGRRSRATSGGITGCRCPQAADLDALNAQLLAGCRADEARVIHGRTQSVGEAVTIERASLRPLAAERVRPAGGEFPAGGRRRLRAREDQSVLGARRRSGRVWKRSSARPTSSCGPTGSVSPGMSGRTCGSSRCSIWSTISTCWSASPARWPARRRWRNAARAGCGRRVTTRCGRT